MDLSEYKIKSLGININKFGKIYSFVDFSNVNYWYEHDIKDKEDNILPSDKKLSIDIEKLAQFCNLFSKSNRFYYGLNPENERSVGFISKVRMYFGKSNTFTKPVQQIKHYLNDNEVKINTRSIHYDTKGSFVYIPKCNFDVEICIDAIKLLEKYDTICLFSSDADFISLVKYLRGKSKKIILVKGGFVQYPLMNAADLVIKAQQIKQYITFIKQKSSQIG